MRMDRLDLTGFVSLEQVTASSGLPAWKIRRRLQSAGRNLWSDPADHRRRLVRRADIAALKAPQRVDFAAKPTPPIAG